MDIRTEMSGGVRKADAHVAIALLYTAAILTLLKYLLPTTLLLRRGWVPGAPEQQQLNAGLIWAAGTVVAFMIVPALIVRFWHREPLAAIGWNARGTAQHAAIYVAIIAIVLPLVYWASLRPDFVSKYPFIPTARTDLGTFLIWELAYAATFLALESFFRGYLLFTCEKQFGWLSVFVMVVPYTMIHFTKPWPEAVGAIVAGLVLGGIALRYRSFIGGAAVHIVIAVSMDALSVHRAGLF